MSADGGFVRAELVDFLRTHAVRADKALSQNYLVEPRVLETILEVLSLNECDTVCEIGVGPGFITRAMAERGARVIGWEKDRRFRTVHEIQFADLARPPLIRYEDARTMSPPDDVPAGGRLLVFGNLPYKITTDLLLHTLMTCSHAALILVMTERAVKPRLVGEPTDKAYGPLGILTNLWGDWHEIMTVPGSAFVPPPRTTSSLFALTPHGAAEADLVSDPGFHRFLVDLFGARRKTLTNAVKRGLGADASARTSRFLRDCGKRPDARPATLAPKELAALYKAVTTG